MSRGFRGRGRWLKFKGGGRDEEQVGLGGRAVCKHTDCSVFRQAANHNTVLEIHLRERHVQDINVNVKSVYGGWRVCPARRLNSLKNTRKRLTNLQTAACAGADVSPRSLRGTVLTYMANAELAHKYKLTVMNSEQLTAETCCCCCFCCCSFLFKKKQKHTHRCDCPVRLKTSAGSAAVHQLWISLH